MSRPHGHCDAPVRLNDLLPDRWQNNFAIGTKEIIVALLHVRTKNIDLGEGLLDEFFHALSSGRSVSSRYVPRNGQCQSICVNLLAMLSINEREN